MSDINDWDVTAAGNNDAAPNGWPENTMRLREVNDTGRETHAAIRRWFADTNGSLVTTGTANSYAVTLNADYDSLFAGLAFVAKINVTNNGASTINVNGLGATAIETSRGDALRGGELVTNGIYAFYYDGTVFQVSASNLDTRLTAFDRGVQVSAGDAATATVELRDSTDTIVGSFNASASVVDLRGASGSETFITANPGAAVTLLHDNVPAVRTTADGAQIRDTSGSSPEMLLVSSTNASLGSLLYTSSEVRLRGLTNSSRVLLQGQDSGGVPRTMVRGDPDADTKLYYQGQERFRTRPAGADVVTSGTTPELRMVSGGGSTQRLRVTVDGTQLTMEGASASETLLTAFFGAGLTLYHNDSAAIGTLAGGGYVRDTSGNQPVLEMDNSAGTLVAGLQVEATGQLTVRNPNSGVNLQFSNGLAFGTRVDGAFVRHAAGNQPVLEMLDSGAALVAGLRVESTGILTVRNPNDAVVLEYDGGDAFGTRVDGAFIRHTVGNQPALDLLNSGNTFVAGLQTEVDGSLTIRNPNEAVDLQFAGTVAFQTRDHTASGELSSARVRDHRGTLRNVGFNDIDVFGANLNTTLGADHVGLVIDYTNSTNYTVTTPGSSSLDFPIDGQTEIENYGTGTITLAAGSGVSLYHLDGSGSPSGVSSLAIAPGGIATVRRKATNRFHVYGAGIS